MMPPTVGQLEYQLRDVMQRLNVWANGGVVSPLEDLETFLMQLANVDDSALTCAIIDDLIALCEWKYAHRNYPRVRDGIAKRNALVSLFDALCRKRVPILRKRLTLQTAKPEDVKEKPAMIVGEQQKPVSKVKVK